MSLPSHSPGDREGTPFPSNSDAAAIVLSDSPSPTPDNHSDVPAADIPVNPLEPGVLTMVVQLVPGQLRLYPNGRWTGPTKYVQHSTDVKLLCTAGRPVHP